MNFLKSDLSRNFAIGFVIGALLVVFQLNPDVANQLVPDAIAANVR